LLTLAALVVAQRAWRSTWAPPGSAARTGLSRELPALHARPRLAEAGD
jgi:hypothetical protein